MQTESPQKYLLAARMACLLSTQQRFAAIMVTTIITNNTIPLNLYLFRSDLMSELIKIA